MSYTVRVSLTHSILATVIHDSFHSVHLRATR